MSMEARLADITTLPVDAIVNAANENLMPGEGVSGAIHEAAGPELLEACRRIGHCPPGWAVITSAFALPARFVVHAVGPRWQGGNHDERELLALAYKHALEVAHNNRCESVALPAIGAGLAGFPVNEAAVIAVTVVRDALEREGFLEEVIFACNTEAELDAFHEAMGVVPS